MRAQQNNRSNDIVVQMTTLCLDFEANLWIAIPTIYIGVCFERPLGCWSTEAGLTLAPVNEDWSWDILNEHKPQNGVQRITVCMAWMGFLWSSLLLDGELLNC
jgi:hypothetical protein